MFKGIFRIILVLTFLYGTVYIAHAVIYKTVPQALNEVFKGNDQIKRSTLYLTGNRMNKAKQMAGKHVPLGNGLVVYYQGIKNGKVMGTAFIDTHRVRTLNETLLIVVSPQGKIKTIEVLSFNEPEDYLVPDRWVRQLMGKEIRNPIKLDNDIAAITGATLTAQAFTLASRRALAYHSAIR